MTSEFDPSPFEAAMWAEVNALEQTRLDIDRLQAELKEKRGIVTDAIRRYGAALQIAELPVPREAIRSLYWEHRDVFVESIATGFGIEGGVQLIVRKLFDRLVGELLDLLKLVDRDRDDG